MKNKIIVIGLDGATFDIIDPLIAKGKLPNLNKIFSNGVKGSLFSSVPPISAPAWVSFLTGRNPGKHGILGFQFYNLSKYSCVEHGIVSSNLYAQNTIFDKLSAYNKRSISFQVPLTYPVWPINGIMIAGYPTPDQTRAFTYPEELSEKIGDLYEYKSDQIASGSVESKLKIHYNSLERVSNKVEELLKEEDYDLFVYVNNITDWIQHKFWKYRENGKVPKDNDYIDQFYIKLDERIGNILELTDDETTVIVMSDHGAGKRPDKFLNINHILREEGLLKPTSKKINIFTKTNKYWFEWIKEFFPMRYWTKAKFSSSFREMVVNTRVYKNNINWNKTKVYRVPLAYPYTGININVKGRQENGIVYPGKEFQDLRKKVYSIFTEYKTKHPDKIENVFYQEEIYNGPNTFNTPDIIVELNENYDSGPEIDQFITEIPSVLLRTISGYHRTNGIFGAMGKNIVPSDKVYNFNIMDVAPTILNLLSLPVDEDMDGRILKEIITEEFLENTINDDFEEDQNYFDNVDLQRLSRQDESDIMNTLCEMGYL